MGELVSLDDVVIVLCCLFCVGVFACMQMVMMLGTLRFGSKDISKCNIFGTYQC